MAVKFRSGDRRSYTYHWDGPPLACGDLVRVPDRSGDGWQRAVVHEIGTEQPTFATKAVLGLLDDTAAPVGVDEMVSLFPGADLPAREAQDDLPSVLDRHRR